MTKVYTKVDSENITLEETSVEVHHITKAEVQAKIDSLQARLDREKALLTEFT